jgi:hypothetical protein
VFLVLGPNLQGLYLCWAALPQNRPHKLYVLTPVPLIEFIADTREELRECLSGEFSKDFIRVANDTALIYLENVGQKPFKIPKVLLDKLVNSREKSRERVTQPLLKLFLMQLL